MDLFWFSSAVPESPAFANRIRRSPVRGSVRSLELHTRRYKVPKTVRFRVPLTRRFRETGSAGTRRCVATFGVGPSEDLPDTCPNNPWMSPSTDAWAPIRFRIVFVRPADRPERQFARIAIPEGPATRVTPGKPAGTHRTKQPFGVRTEGSTHPKADPSSTASGIDGYASTPSETILGTFAGKSEDLPAGPSTRKYPTPGSGIPT